MDALLLVIENTSLWTIAGIGWLVIFLALYWGYADKDISPNTSRPAVKAFVVSILLMAIALVMAWSLIASRGV
jgi:uncharacterized membrane protein